MTNDQIFKTIDIVMAQSNDLWPISTGLILVSFGILASPSKSETGKRPVGAVFWLLATLVLSIASLFFGYVVKGSLITGVAKFTTPEVWSLAQVEKWSFFQLGSTIGAAIAFGILLLSYRNFSIEALARYTGK